MNTSELVEKLDAKYSRWDLYRTAYGGWCVRLPEAGEVVSGKTIEEALSNAAEYVPLPEVPRQPSPPVEHTVEKDGSKWCVRRGEWIVVGGLTTKKKATEVAKRFQAIDEQSFRSWNEKWAAWLVGKTEGVDFRWAK